MLKLKNMNLYIDGKIIEQEEDKDINKLLIKVNEIIDKTQLPVITAVDQIKDGLINVKTYDCITFVHSEMGNKYYKFALAYTEKKHALMVFNYGESKNYKKLDKRKRAKSNAKTGLADTMSGGGTIIQAGGFNNIISGAIGGMMSIGGSKKKQEAEEMYYDQLNVLLENIV